MKNKSFVEKIASCFISDRSKRRFGLKDSSKAPTSSKLRLEALEKRELLAADLLNAVAFGPAPALVDVPNPRDETIPFSLSNSTSGSTDLPIITTDSEAPQTWNVTLNSDDWENPIKGTLRYAINNAKDGDTIKFDSSLVGNPIILSGSRLRIDKSITIDASEYYNAETQECGITIDADEKSSAIAIGAGTEAQPVVLSGLTIRRGKTEGEGGGICVWRSANVKLINTTISDNSADSGGGIYANFDSTVTLVNASISGNTAVHTGGGVCVTGSLVVTDSIISNNSALKFTGGIYVHGTSLIVGSTIGGNSARSGSGGIRSYGTATITNTIISSNNSNGEGGGIWADGTVTIEGSNIVDNTAAGCAGGIYSECGTITLNDSNVSRNSCIDAIGATMESFGGGIYTEDEVTIIATGTTISNNSAGWYGGIYAGGGATLTNVKISSNSATRRLGGGGVRGVFKGTNVEISQNTAYSNGGFGVGGKTTLINTTIAGNSAKGGRCGGLLVASKDCSLKNCIVSRNYNGDVDGMIDYENDCNIVGYNPGFVCEPTFNDDGDLTNGNTLDLRLRSDSTAVDAGSNEAATEITVDLDGENRVYGERVDLGAYEYQGDHSDAPFYSSVVNTSNDSFDPNDDEWSLREAIYYAPGYVTITFADSVTEPIVLSKELVVGAVLAIDGGKKITLDGNGTSSVFSVYGGTRESPISIFGLTITNGKADSDRSYSSRSVGGFYVSSGSVVKIKDVDVSNNQGAGFYADSNAAVTLTNTTISNNESSGVLAYFDASVTLIDSEVSNNGADGIYAWARSTITMNNTTVADNANCGVNSATAPLISATNSFVLRNKGYGIYVKYTLGIYQNIQVWLSNTLVSENKLGGICANSYCADPDDKNKVGHTELTLIDSTISNNEEFGVQSYQTTATNTNIFNNGGYGLLTGQANLTNVNAHNNSGCGLSVGGQSNLTNVNVYDNSGDGLEVGRAKLTNVNAYNNNGYGLYIYGQTNLTNATISDNKGGGVYVDTPSEEIDVTLTNAVISGNTSSYGGGVYIDYNSKVTLKNATVYGNKSLELGGGIYTRGGKTTLENTIVVGNYVEGKNDESNYYNSMTDRFIKASTARNVLSSGVVWDDSYQCVEYDSNLPLFNDAENGDFSLPFNSQALDKGSSDYVSVRTDRVGGARIVGQSVDLGAYEYHIPLTEIALSTDAPKQNEEITTTLIPNDASATYRWYRVNSKSGMVLISNANESSYTPTAADAGYKIRVVATGSSSDYFSGTQTATTSEYAVGVLSDVSISMDSDILLDGTTLTANVDPSVATVSYQWSRVKNDVVTPIDGATKKTYTATKKDVGSILQVTVDGTGYWSGTKTAQTESVRTALTGITLSTYAPTPNVAVTTTLLPQGAAASYQWYRVDANGDETAIDGANESSYTPTAADSSYYLKVVASGTGDYALSVEAISTDLYVKPQTVKISNPTEETIARAVHNVKNCGTITLAGDATISIASTINVDKSLTIKGADDAKIVFDGRSVMPTTSSVLLTTGNDSSTRRQLYNVEAGKTLTLENVTLQYGYADFGGAIYNAGTVTLTDVTLLNNEASINGGAVFCTPTGTLSINGKTTFEGNSAGNSGGAIMNYGTVTVDSKATSTFEGNNALNFGGAYFGCGAFTVDGTADFTGNYVNSSESKGGAIYNDAYTSNKGAKFQGVVTINGSATFNGNSAESRGGAIMTYGDATSDYVSLKVSGSSVTFTQNAAAYGGAIDVGKSAKATFSGGVDFGTEGDSKSGNTADYGGAIYSAGSVSFTTGGTYDFYNNVANKSGGAICTSNYVTKAGSDYVAGSLNLVGSFVFDGNKANGSESEGLGGAIATATSTTVQFDKDDSNKDKITWKNNFANGYGDCVSIDTTIVQNRNLTPNCFGISDSDYSTFKIIRLEQTASTSPLTPKMLATNAVAATITVGEATKTFGAEGVSPAQLGLDAGTHQALVQYVDANGETSAFYTLELTVDADASLNVRETNIADGRGVKFNFDLVKEGGRAVSVWEIAWGDGTTTRSENWSTSWMAAHYYAKDGVYDVSLTATYLDGSRETFDAFSTQNVGAAPVATTGDSEVLSVVFAEVEDVFDEFDDLDLFVPFGPALPRR